MSELIPKDLINKLKIPKLYETENLSNPICHLKLFTPDSIWEWYIIEISIDLDTCYGYTKGFEGELGYFSLNELNEIRGNLGLGVERDLSFKPTKTINYQKGFVMLKNIYIQNEARKSFKGWTKEGLEFLLIYPSLSKRIKSKIESRLKGEF